MRTVEVIKPSNKYINQVTKEVIKKRVCAYARVSTDDEDQLNSYKAQIDEYTTRIQENDDWIFIGMFADQGISGTQTKKRPEFLKMIALARLNEVDLILVKSISRFARNTVDVLSLVRELRQIGVIIYFEKENLYSDDPKIDFTLAILSSIAQEESSSISTNVKWSIEKRFKAGIVHIPKIYGYIKMEDGSFIINETQAEVVKLIYSLFIEGYNINDIRKILEEKGIPATSRPLWSYSSVRSILTNEKYTGNIIMQKTVTLDYLTHKQVINDNIADKYYLKNAHPVIIHSAVYEIAQTIYNDKVRYSKNLVTKYPLTNLIYCKNCGRTLRRHHLGEVKQLRKICLDCRHTTMDTKPCDASWVEETLVNDTMDQAIKDILSKKKAYQRVLDYYASNYTLNSLYKRFEDLSEELIEVNNIKANAEGNELKGIHKEETIIKTKIQKIRKDMMHLQRNASTIKTLKNLYDNPNQEIPTLFYKHFFGIIIHQSGELILVLSKSHETHELLPLINQLVKYPILLENLHIDYELKKGLNYKVILHE
ncbi:MAG: recombinase family protein [Firmicutes bacterium]|nr:recombinase family protein [Bacillota bacterium]